MSAARIIHGVGCVGWYLFVPLKSYRWTDGISAPADAGALDLRRPRWSDANATSTATVEEEWAAGADDDDGGKPDRGWRACLRDRRGGPRAVVFGPPSATAKRSLARTTTRVGTKPFLSHLCKKKISFLMGTVPSLRVILCLDVSTYFLFLNKMPVYYFDQTYLKFN